MVLTVTSAYIESSKCLNSYIFIGLEIRQRGRFAGFSLYISNSDVTTTDDIQSSILCFKDGPELPPLNFTATCTEHGQFVIYYNERLNGVEYPGGYEQTVYTELCEVIVQGKCIL